MQPTRAGYLITNHTYLPLTLSQTGSLQAHSLDPYSTLPFAFATHPAHAPTTARLLSISLSPPYHTWLTIIALHLHLSIPPDFSKKGSSVTPALPIPPSVDISRPGHTILPLPGPPGISTQVQLHTTFIAGQFHVHVFPGLHISNHVGTGCRVVAVGLDLDPARLRVPGTAPTWLPRFDPRVGADATGPPAASWAVEQLIRLVQPHVFHMETTWEKQ